VILLILVMAMSMIFHQASNSWSAGLRKTEGNMNGRSTLGFIARDLQGAVADPDTLRLQGRIECTTNLWPKIAFVTLNGNVSTNYRAATRIMYEYDKPRKTVARTEEKTKIGDDYKASTWVDGVTVVLATNVSDFGFSTPPRDIGDPYADAYTKDLPKWVRVKLVFTWAADVSGLSAVSGGPDGIFDTKDDISSN